MIFQVKNQKLSRATKIFISVGEPSGDFLGGQLMAQLNASFPKISYVGIGGEHCQAQGLQSLFPMGELSHMGLVEILPHIFQLRRRLAEAVSCVVRELPDVIVTIDSPGFNFLLAKRLKKLGLGIPLVHYVAPSVWAWKERRAAKIAGIYDHLLTLFPFEPPYFEKHNLPTTFVGHPLVELGIQDGGSDSFREKYGISKEKRILCILPGSRRGELKRLLPILGRTVALLASRIPDLHIVIPTLGSIQAHIDAVVKEWAVPVTVVLGSDEKYAAFRSSHAAIAASGTVTLELALAKVPMVVTYRVNMMTAWLLKRLIKTPFFCLVNILLKKRAVPEVLQGSCNPSRLAEVASYLLEESPARQEQVKNLKDVSRELSVGKSTPSEVAANVVLSYIRSH